MTPAFDRALKGVNRRTEVSLADQREPALQVSVIFTSVEATSAALDKAEVLARNLGGQITLLVPEIVPYPLPLTSPPVRLEFQERRFRELTARTSARVQVRLYLCRDGAEALKTVLRPHSLVVVGARRRLWPTRAKSLARKLRRMGHEVIVAETRQTGSA